MKLTHEVNDTVGVAIFVIIPSNKLDEFGVEHDTSLGIEDRGDGAGNEILGDKVFIGVSEDALYVTSGTALDLCADFLNFFFLKMTDV